MDFEGGFGHVAAWVDVNMVVIIGSDAIYEFDAGDFDDFMALARV